MMKKIALLLVISLGMMLVAAPALAWEVELVPPETNQPPTAPSAATVTPRVTEATNAPSGTSNAPGIDTYRGRFATSASSYCYDNAYPVDDARIVDRDANTAWCTNGFGVNEWVELSVTDENLYQVTGFDIINGYTKSVSTFSNNARVERVEVLVDRVSVGTYELKDTMDQQTVTFDAPICGNSFRFVIRSVYDGKKYEDTGITEITLKCGKIPSGHHGFEERENTAKHGISQYQSASEVPEDGYFCPESENTLLSVEDLRATSTAVLGYVRNEILARYGYEFKTDKYKRYFNSRSWYRPGGFDYRMLNSVEGENVERIKEEEAKR